MDGLHDPLERMPRRRDPPTWLKENPDYEVEGDMLEVNSWLLFMSWFINKPWWQFVAKRVRDYASSYLVSSASCEPEQEEEKEEGR